MRFLDLDTESRRALEFDAVLDGVASLAATAMGAAAIRALRPAADGDWIEAEIAAVGEASRHLAAHGRCLAKGLPDPGPVLASLAPEGGRLDGTELRDLAAVLATADELARGLSALDRADYPRLHALGAALPRWRDEAEVVVECVGPDGRLTDDASSELGRIRRQIGRVGERLRGMLQGLVRDPDAEAFIRDDFVTQRNGRFVIPVRADAARPVKGIVHASSSSGATLFVEPLESVELNNELVQLAERELEEADRILRVWTAVFRDRLEEVERTLSGVARIDSLQARALWAEAEGAIRPQIGVTDELELREVRHPLLDRSLREQGSRCVPLTFRLEPGERVLVLSGPNTGGKTVALKTLGLATLMAQSGLPVSAAEARLPLFHQLRADIGDHQSIEANLSTFSAHVGAVSRFLREASSPALFLFDEIGTGTEPAEGAALARAILERVLDLKVNAVATTHQSPLKAWAATTEGAVSAAMEFDLARLRPTYRVILGVAGISAGLDIASRFEIPPEVVERARELLGPDASRAEGYLDAIHERLAELDEELRQLAARRAELEADYRGRIERLERDESKRGREAERTLDAALDDLTAMGRREVAAIRETAARARAEKKRAKVETRLHAEAARKKAQMRSPVEPSRAKPPASLETGTRVFIRSLGREGEVVSARGKAVRVRLGSATFSVDRDDLAAAAGGDASAAPSRPVTRVRAPEVADSLPYEIVLIGQTVDEALRELDRQLDRAALAGRNEIRVVHGHGTGRLRKAVRQFLTDNPLVKTHRPGRPAEGGEGATIATLT
jgi:DNA mismatch repair protein MutS2